MRGMSWRGSGFRMNSKGCSSLGVFTAIFHTRAGVGDGGNKSWATGK